MMRCWRRCGFQLVIASAVLVGGAIAISGDCAFAQIAPDGTLPNNSIVTSQGNTSVISGGTQAGSNLFHSFDQFSIPTGGAAYFNNGLDIQNVFSRVTGKSISNIDGLIRANGIANLFLLNPNGIIFGPNASLNIGGSFLASTANSLNFPDGSPFSATAPQTTPLLSVSVPLGLQFGGTAGSILNQSQVTNSIGEAVGLQVQPGKTLALVGGDVSVDGGILQAPGGRVELGGLAGAGTVGLFVDDNNLRLSFPDGVARADVSLTNGSGVDVTADGGGSIAINAQNIDVLGKSFLYAGIGSGLGSVNSQAGDITLNAKEAIGANDSVIGNSVSSGAIGNGGDVKITTGSLSLTNGAQLGSVTLGRGDAGSVTINARDTVSFDGNDSDGFPSGAFSTVEEEGAVGNGGDINITTGSLFLTNGALISSSTRGRGDAGNVTINARDTVSFDGEGRDGFSSKAASVVNEEAMGKGGSVNITTGSLSLTNGAQVSASTYGQGDAGSVIINARDTVSFDGEGSDEANSGAFSRVYEEAVGKGGSVNITTGLLSLTNGAQLTASSAGSGAAGNIEVSATSMRLDNEALLSSNTVGGEGNIRLRSPSLILRRGSNITTNATGSNITGGNITIDTDVLAAVENSDISANSNQFFGGQVRINAQGIFGTEFQLAPTPKSDITATGGSPELSGTVEINIPDVNPSQGLVELPAVPIDTEVVQACQPGGSQQQSEFIITGRGGLPPNPGEVLRTDAVLVDLMTLNPGLGDSSSPAVSTNPTAPVPAPIVEAQGWVINNNGEVVLTARPSNVTPHSPWISSATCHTPQASS